MLTVELPILTCRRVFHMHFRAKPERPVVVAGPCTAESPEIMKAVAQTLTPLAKELGFDLIFKASFDKANRTSVDSYRGPGLKTALRWFTDIKTAFGVPVLTDIHETAQVAEAAEVIDVLQIPAFLCRQTDLVVAAAATGRAVNVKKGQFLPPEQVSHIVSKVHEASQKAGIAPNLALTERGASFGYGDLIVDMRSFPIMAKSGAALIFDITHSLQKPGGGSKTTGGAREFAPTLARAATATGYLAGYFLEVHPEPAKAKSDAATQVSPEQAAGLLRQIIPLWRETVKMTALDASFQG